MQRLPQAQHVAAALITASVLPAQNCGPLNISTPGCTLHTELVAFSPKAAASSSNLVSTRNLTAPDNAARLDTIVHSQWVSCQIQRASYSPRSRSRFRDDARRRRQDRIASENGEPLPLIRADESHRGPAPESTRSSPASNSQKRIQLRLTCNGTTSAETDGATRIQLS